MGFRRLKVAAVGLVVAGAVVVLFVFDPATRSVYPSCPFRALTGLHCPGCGTLRAIHQLMHGDLSAALALNPLMVLCLPPLAYAAATSAVRWTTGRNVPRMFVPAFWIWTLGVVVILYWILRNVPVEPFSWLAPAG